MKRVSDREENDGEKTAVVHKTLLVQSPLNLFLVIIIEVNVSLKFKLCSYFLSRFFSWVVFRENEIFLII